jgi:hypothetical protein
MEQERFFSGYCKALDQSRMVSAVMENGELTEVDCAYPNCPHAPGCPIAAALEESRLG